MKKVRVRDLRDQLGTRCQPEFLYCTVCEERNSAHAGDYFMLPKDYVFECCGKPMMLARETRRIVAA